MATSLQQITGSPLSALRSQFRLCYSELERMAHSKLRFENQLQTLDTSALVHEAYNKMASGQRKPFSDDHHFLAIAAIVMRRILIDYARQKKRQKRGGDKIQMTYGAVAQPLETTPEVIIQLDESLKRLRQLNKRQSRVVEYHFFGGYSHEEIAAMLKVSVETVRRDWRLARAWLSSQIKQ